MMIRDGYWNEVQDYTFEWHKAIQQKYGLSEEYIRESYARNFPLDSLYHTRWADWIKTINTKDYYVFILTKEQLEGVQNARQFMIDKGLDKYKVYESEYAVNINHKESGPRLKMFIFHFPEGYSNV